MNKVIKNELKLLQLEHRKSKEVLDNLLAEDFLEIVPSGTEWSKQQIIQSLTSPSTEEEAYEASDIKARPIAKNIVMLTYITKKPSQIEQQKRTSIWQKRKGRWQMVFHQGTIIK